MGGIQIKSAAPRRALGERTPVRFHKKQSVCATCTALADTVREDNILPYRILRYMQGISRRLASDQRLQKTGGFR